jgi:hypothetical protein
MSQQYPKDAAGRIFPKNQPVTDERHPTWQGDLTIPAEMLPQLVQLSQERGGADVRLRVVAWDKQGKSGAYLSISGRIDRLQPGDDPNAIPRHYPVQQTASPPRYAPSPQQPYAPAPQQAPYRPGAQPHPGQTRPMPRVVPDPRRQRPFDDNPNFNEPRDKKPDDETPPWE